MPAEIELNPFTGLPLDGSGPTIDTTGNEKGEELNPFTQEPLKDIAPTTGIGKAPKDRTLSSQAILRGTSSTNRGEDIGNYTKYGVTLAQGLDWDEARARKQPVSEKWIRGLSKAGVTTVGAFIENTAGILAGIGELVTGGAYYDNAVGRQVDATNEWMREHFPNYVTEAESKMNPLQKMGRANFWADTVANGLGYSLGSIATLYVTGGMGLVGLGSKAVGAAGKGVAAYKAANAISTGTKLGAQLGKGAVIGNRLKTHASMFDAAVMMSFAEASVEARESQKNSYNMQIEDYLEKNLLDHEGQIPTNVLEEFEKKSYAIGNTNFITQLPVLAGTQLVMFAGRMAGFKPVNKAGANTILDSKTGKFISKFQNQSKIRTLGRRLSPMGKGMATESFQEGYQFASGAFAERYHLEKYQDHGYGDMVTALNKSVSETFGDNAGLESMLVGAIVGGLMGVKGAVTGAHVKRENTQAQIAADFRNRGMLDSSMSLIGVASQKTAAAKRMDDAAERGDTKGFRDAQHDLIAYNTLEALENGTFDVSLQQLEDLKELSDEEFIKTMGGPDSDMHAILADQSGVNKAEIIDDLKNKMKSFKEVYDNVNDQFELPPKLVGLPRQLMSSEQREGIDEAYAQRDVARAELILKGFKVNDRNARLEEVEGLMHKTKKESLDEKDRSRPFDISLTATPRGDIAEGTSVEDMRSEKALTDATGKRLKDILNEEAASFEDKVAKQKFINLAQEYMNLSVESSSALAAYNTLATDPGARMAFAEKTREAQKETAQKAQAKAFAENMKAATTSAEVTDAFEKAGKPEYGVGAKAKRHEELRQEEVDAYNKYSQTPGSSPEEKLANLKAIDRSELSPTEKVGLEELIRELEADETVDTLDPEVAEMYSKDSVDPNTPPFTPPGEKEGGKAELPKQEVEDPELTKEKTSKVEEVSEDGREFIIDGERWFNRHTHPLDAITRGKNSGKIKTVTLENAEGIRKPFWGPQERVDALAYAIIRAEAAKIEGETWPSIVKAKAKAAQEAADKILENLYGENGKKTTESLWQEVIKLLGLQQRLEEELDEYRNSLISMGFALDEIKQDPDIKARQSKIRSVIGKASLRKTILKQRGENILPEHNESLKISARIQERIEESEEIIRNSELRIEQIDQEIADLTERKAKYKEVGGEEDLISWKKANAQINKLKKEKDKEKYEEILFFKAMIEVDQEQLKLLKDERNGTISEPGEKATERAPGGTQEQTNSGENTDTGSVSEEAQDDVAAPTQMEMEFPEAAKEKVPEKAPKKEVVETRIEHEGTVYLVNISDSTVRDIVRGEDVEESEELFAELQQIAIEKIEKAESPTKRTPIKSQTDKAVEKTISHATSKENAKKPLEGMPGENTTTEEITFEEAPSTAGTMTQTTSYGTPKGPTVTTASTPAQQTNEVILGEKGELVLKRNNKTNEDIIELIDGSKLIRGIDSKGEVYFEVEGNLSELEFLGFDSNNFTFDENKIASVINELSNKELLQPTQQTSGVREVAEGNPVIEEMSFEEVDDLPPPPTTVPPKNTAPDGELDIQLGMTDRTVRGEDRQPKFPGHNAGYNSAIEVSATGIPFTNVDTVKGVPIEEDRTLWAGVKPGTEVRLTLVENDWYTRTYPQGKEDKIPIYVQLKDPSGTWRNVGKLNEKPSQDETVIRQKLLAGEEVTVPIKNVMAPNLNNARTTDGKRFWSDPSSKEMFGAEPALAIVKWVENEHLFESPNSDIRVSGRDPGKAAPGQVAFIIPKEDNPEGVPGIVMGSTSNLTSQAIDKSIELLSNGKMSVVETIVSNSNVNERGQRTSSAHSQFLEFLEEKSGELTMIYNSPLGPMAGKGTSQPMVKISEQDMQKALNNKPFEFEFVVIDQQGNYTTIKRTDQVKAAEKVLEEKLEEDLRGFLTLKKYNIEFSKLEKTAQFESPVTGERYNSYSEYLFSENEISDKLRQGHNSILAVDLVKTSTGYYHDPIVTFGKGDLINTTEEAANVVSYASSNTSTAEGFEEMGLDNLMDDVKC